MNVSTVIVPGVDAQSTPCGPSCPEPFLENAGYVVRHQARKGLGVVLKCHLTLNCTFISLVLVDENRRTAPR